MYRLIAAMLCVLLLAFPASAHGQDYVRFRLPEGHRCIVAGDTFQCFDLGEYVELLHIDEDLRNLTELHDANLLRIEALTQASDELQRAIESANAAIAAHEEERTRLIARWEEENRLRHEAENRPNMDWIPWTLAGAFAIATLILALVVGVH